PTHREDRGFWRAGDAGPTGALYRIRYGGRHRLASGQAALRPPLRFVLGIGPQASLPDGRGRQVAALHTRRGAAIPPHDERPSAAGLGAQYIRAVKAPRY